MLTELAVPRRQETLTFLTAVIGGPHDSPAIVWTASAAVQGIGVAAASDKQMWTMFDAVALALQTVSTRPSPAAATTVAEVSVQAI